MHTKYQAFVALLLVFCVFLGGCNNDPSNTPEEETPTVTYNEDAYLEIPLRKCPGIVRKTYGIKDSSAALVMKFYEDWEHRDDGEGGYSLWRDGKQIGRIEAGEGEDRNAWTVISERSTKPAQLQATHYLEKSVIENALHFRHRYCYRYSENGQTKAITLTLAYGEIDEYTQIELLGQITYKERYTDPMYGVLSNSQDKPILVLGNSFIGTSQIGNIYNEIARVSGKEELMMAVAEGYATVKTYAESEYVINRIENGDWSAVFMCGFYGDMNHELGIIKRACEKSGTKLIIFPAHNENSGMVTKAMEAYPDLLCINWKREIEQLIVEGRSKWDFCYDDEHLHSTPLAGYVGAMMIWRAIWGEMPAVEVEDIPQDYYDSILGSYLTNPSFELIDPSRIILLE